MTADKTRIPVTLIGGGPGAWDLITLRGARALQEADVILTDHLGPTDALEKIIDTSGKEIIDVAKLPYGRTVAQEETNRLLVEHARAGKKVARLKGGDPFVFGRGFEEVLHLAEHGIACEVVPGVTSAISVPAAANVPVTHRGITHSFTVVSGHLAPGDSRSLVDWSALAKVGGTIVVVMGVRHVADITAALIDAGLDPTTPAAAVMEGTTERQVSVATSVAKLAEDMAAAGIGSPAVYIIGAVSSLG